MGSAQVGAGWPRLSRLLPGDVTTFRGPRWTAGMLAAVNAVGTARSLVHVLAPDSGAESIASMVTSEQALRVGIGSSKPLDTTHRPPGAMSWGLLPAAAAALAVSLTERSGAPLPGQADR